jgi:hypothetical protein
LGGQMCALCVTLRNVDIGWSVLKALFASQYDGGDRIL